MISQEEKFVLNLAKFEEERIENNLETYNLESYLNEEFSFDISAKNASTKVYNVIQKAWTEGVLELFIRNNILTNKLEVKDLVAFDAARFTKLVLQVLELKLLEEKEAWGLLFLNAQRVQDAFESAEIFKTSYFKGALFYDILFKSDEDDRAEKIGNFDVLLRELQKSSKTELSWLKEDVFKSFKIEKSSSNEITSNVPNDANKIHKLLKKEDKNELWQFLDALTEEERNKVLPKLYIEKKDEAILTAEDYLELPALNPNVSYAHYLRAVYFYNYAWEARGLGITNTVGQKNYALFYERLRYARVDLKKAYELSPNEQSYWAELYNLVKHFKNKDSDHLEEDLYGLIKENSMQNPFCIQRVSHMKKARWGGSHKESLEWAREVISHSNDGDSMKIIIFEVLIEQYQYILEYDKDEEKANAVFKDVALQDEINQYFEELLERSYEVKSTLLFWYKKVSDEIRIKKITNLL
jgi:hypothetical protein